MVYFPTLSCSKCSRVKLFATLSNEQRYENISRTLKNTLQLFLNNFEKIWIEKIYRKRDRVKKLSKITYLNVELILYSSNEST